MYTFQLSQEILNKKLKSKFEMKVRRLILCIFIVMVGLNVLKAQSQHGKTKLMVTIIVDQMRDEYLHRFYDHFEEGGFKRLMQEGLVLRDVQYNYVPTFTGPGHSSVFTGTTPKYHGIIGNSWYDRSLKKSVYCAEDTTVSGVGSNSENGMRSPFRLLSTTLADELEISTQHRALTYSISLKDRAAILSGGHMCDRAFWYDNTSGKFITSTYYAKQLPEWVTAFNDKKLADEYMQNEWNFLLDKTQYDDSEVDKNNYEHPGNVLHGVKEAVFPYPLKKIGKSHTPYDLLIHTPWGNTILTDMAVETINNVDLGKDNITDMLMISFSSTDAIGHLWGPQSKEIEDTYLRLDKELNRLLNTLDQKVGKGNYTVMLTADHAVGEVVEYLDENRIPAGFFNMDRAAQIADSILDTKYAQDDWIENYHNHIIYFNKELFNKHHVNMEKACADVAYFITTEMEGVYQAFTCFQLMKNEYKLRGASHLQMGYNTKRSGEIMLTFEPGWATGKPKASADHGTQYCYDTHVPLIFYGNGVKSGEDVNAYEITDVAPTISLLLKIKFPNACMGHPITTLWKQH